MHVCQRHTKAAPLRYFSPYVSYNKFELLLVTKNQYENFGKSATTIFFMNITDLNAVWHDAKCKVALDIR